MCSDILFSQCRLNLGSLHWFDVQNKGEYPTYTYPCSCQCRRALSIFHSNAAQVYLRSNGKKGFCEPKKLLSMRPWLPTTNSKWDTKKLTFEDLKRRNAIAPRVDTRYSHIGSVFTKCFRESLEVSLFEHLNTTSVRDHQGFVIFVVSHSPVVPCVQVRLSLVVGVNP